MPAQRSKLCARLSRRVLHHGASAVSALSDISSPCGAGFPDDGVTISREKTKISFDCTAPGGGGGGGLLPRQLVHDGVGAAFLPWCGLLINTSTLDIQVGHVPAAPPWPLLAGPSSSSLLGPPAPALATSHPPSADVFNMAHRITLLQLFC